MGLIERFKSFFDEKQGVTVVSGWGFGDSGDDAALIREAFVTNADVYAIIKELSLVASSIPLVLKSTNSKGEEEIITSGDLYDFLQMPSLKLSQKEFIEQSFIYLLASGDLFYKKVLTIGFVTDELTIYPSGLVDIEPGKSYLDPPKKYIFHDKGGFDTNISVDDIIHIKYLDPTIKGLDSMRGLSPLKAARLSVKASSSIQKAASVTVENQGVRGILTNRSDRALTDDAKKDMQKISNQKLSGTSNFNKIFASNANVDFVQLGMSAADLKILELGVLSLRQICNAYGTMSVLYGDEKASKFANLKEAEKKQMLKGVLPTLENKILWTLNQTVINEYSERDGVKYELSVDRDKIEILQEDQKVKADKENSLSVALTSVLIAAIPRESKIKLLMLSHNMTEENAVELVGIEIIIPDGQN